MVCQTMTQETRRAVWISIAEIVAVILVAWYVAANHMDVVASLMRKLLG